MILAATPTVEVSFDATSPDVPGTWTDITQWVRQDPGVQIVRGRSAERSDTPTAGTLSLTLDNSDGRFSPRNTAGAYYPNVKARRPIRVRVEFNAVVETIFQGFIDGGWPQDYATTEQLVQLQAVDALGFAAQNIGVSSSYEVEVEKDAASIVAWYPCGQVGEIIERQSSKSAWATGDISVDDAHVVGDVGSTRFGKNGSYFTTRDQALFLPASPFIEPATIEFWCRLDADDQEDFDLPIYYEYGTGGTNGYRVAVQMSGNSEATRAGGLLMGGWSGTGLVYEYWSHTTYGGTDWNRSYFADGNVHHVVIAFGGTVVREDIDVYVDGKRWSHAGTGAMADSPGATGSPLEQVVGCNIRNPARRQLVGSISHLVLYDAKLSRDRIHAHYVAGMNGLIADTLDERFSWLVEQIGWSAVGQVDGSPRRTSVPFDASSNSFDEIVSLELSEQGRVWCDRGGDLRFSNRSWSTVDTVSTTEQFHFADDGSGSPYLADGVSFVEDDRAVVNDAVVTRRGGSPQRAKDQASIDAYGPRSSDQLSDLELTSDGEAKVLAAGIVYLRSEVQPRVERLAFNPERQPAVLWPLVQTIDEGHLGRVVRHPTDGDVIDLQAHVVGIAHDWSNGFWETTLLLDGTLAGHDWMTWGDFEWGDADGEGWAWG